MPLDRETLLKTLRDSGAAALAAMLAVPERGLETGAYENGWNVHQLMAHLAALEYSYRQLAGSAQSAERPAADAHARPFDMNAYNARQVDRRRESSAAALCAEFAAGRAALIIDAEGYADALFQQPVRSVGGSAGSFAEVLTAIASEHVLGHATDLTSAAGVEPGEADRSVAALQIAAEEAAQICEQTPAAGWLQRSAVEDWSPANVAGHTAEIMPYWAQKAASAAASPGIVIGRDLNAAERLGALVDAEALSPLQAAARIRDAAQAACVTLRSIPAGHWDRDVETLRFGKISLRQCLRLLVIEHAGEHARQLDLASGRRFAQTV